MKTFQKYISFQNFNGPKDGPINHESGSEYIIKTKNLPSNMQISDKEWGFCCDGDGDRSISYFKENNKISLLNGDYNMALFALSLFKLREKYDFLNKLKIGAVCTLYSDQNMIFYLKNVTKTQVYMAPTGVKWMLQVKKENQLDIAIISEFNGHFSLHISDKAKKHITESSSKIDKLTHSFFSNLINSQTKSGDFLGIFLNFHFTKTLCGLSLPDIQKLYVEKEKKTVKYIVKNKEAVILDEINAIHKSPKGLQNYVNSIMEKYSKQKLRFFIRKSGTEDILRVHFECEDGSILEEVEKEVQTFILNHSEIN